MEDLLKFSLTAAFFQAAGSALSFKAWTWNRRNAKDWIWDLIYGRHVHQHKNMAAPSAGDRLLESDAKKQVIKGRYIKWEEVAFVGRGLEQVSKQESLQKACCGSRQMLGWALQYCRPIVQRAACDVWEGGGCEKWHCKWIAGIKEAVACSALWSIWPFWWCLNRSCAFLQNSVKQLLMLYEKKTNVVGTSNGRGGSAVTVLI